MKFFLELNQEQAYGQIPITGPNGKVEYIIKGNLDNPNHTLYLADINQKEIGRLYTEKTSIITTFTIDVINHSLVEIKKLNSPITNTFFVSRLNYLVIGNIKKGTYTFRHGFKNVASVKTIVGNSGVILVCDISLPEDIPFILLIAVLLTQWHVTPLKLPTFPPIGRKFSTDQV